MRHRIVQFRGKRYSLKLDELVWQSLEEAAQAAGVRLNELVASVAQQSAEGANLTSALRRYCLDQARDRACHLDEELRRLSLAARGVSMTLIADACPSPCLAVSQERLILHANAAAQKWTGVEAAALLGKSVDHYFQIKSTQPLARILEQFAAGASMLVHARIVYLRPGRLIVARANLCPAKVDGSGDLAFFIFIDTVGSG